MIAATTFAGKAVAVFGLGRSGNTTCEALIAGGANVAAWDDNETARAQSAELGIPIRDLRQADWREFDTLVLAPGVPLTHPEPHWTVTRAQEAGVEVIGDTEIFFREVAAFNARTPQDDLSARSKVVAITGTNGKSTTTALIGHVLKAAGADVHVGGNIGIAVLSLPDIAGARVYVLEMSSYQIDLTPSLAPDIGLLLNVTPDHIDRHGTFARYAAIKKRLVQAAAIALVNLDDVASRTAAERLAMTHRDVRTVSIADATADYHVHDGKAARLCRFSAAGDAFQSLATVTGIATLRGDHNLSNALFVAATADCLGIAPATFEPGFVSFPGLAHRMQLIGELDGILIYNDSKATNADSADRALAAFNQDIFWIAGGLAKDGGIAPLASHFGKLGGAFLIGEAAEDFSATLASDRGSSGSVPVTMSGTVEAAAHDALAAALAQLKQGQKSGQDVRPVVLLSPACASFDQFRNFELRGDAFRRAVAAFPGVKMLDEAGA